MFGRFRAKLSAALVLALSLTGCAPTPGSSESADADTPYGPEVDINTTIATITEAAGSDLVLSAALYYGGEAYLTIRSGAEDQTWNWGRLSGIPVKIGTTSRNVEEPVPASSVDWDAATADLSEECLFGRVQLRFLPGGRVYRDFACNPTQQIDHMWIDSEPIERASGTPDEAGFAQALDVLASVTGNEAMSFSYDRSDEGDSLFSMTGPQIGTIDGTGQYIRAELHSKADWSVPFDMLLIDEHHWSFISALHRASSGSPFDPTKIPASNYARVVADAAAANGIAPADIESACFEPISDTELGYEITIVQGLELKSVSGSIPLG